MSSPSETIYDYFKANVYQTKYMDRFDLSNDPANPLLNIVPLSDIPDFFAPKVCNVICLTKPYVDWDWESVEETLNRLIETYDQFGKYEAHFMIDEDADEIQDASSSSIDETIDNFITLINDYSAGDYGIHFWGSLNTTALQERINTILSDFYS